jgi:ligand-binding sensor domain-containing protein
LPLGTLADFAIDREGTVWAATHAGLARLDGMRWRHIGQDWGYPGISARALFVDRDGTLWVATEDTLVFLPVGQKAFQKTNGFVRTVDRIAQSPDGAIWIVEVGRIWKFLDASGNKDPQKKLGITLQGPGILFDRAGSLWISTWGAGVLRLPFPEQLKNERPSSDIEKFTLRDGLTDDTQDALLQDHEGNIWVGTKGGLDRFRRTDLSPVALPTRTRVTLAAGNHGDVFAFLGLEGNEFVHVLRTAGVTQRFGHRVTCAYRDTSGVIWLGGPEGIWRFNDGNGHYARIPKIPNALGEGAMAKQFETARTRRTD